MPPGVRESMLGYHSCNMKVLTCTRESGGDTSGGQFDWGGRLLKVTEAFKGWFSTDGNRATSANA